MRDTTGSLAAGGAAAAVYSVVLALSAPILGRQVDRRGQTAVLTGTGVVFALGLAGFAALPEGTPLAPALACSALAGAAYPPLGACLRTLWPRVLPDSRYVHAAFGLESAAIVVLVAGMLAARAGPSADPARRLVLLLLAIGVADGLLVLAPPLGVLAVLLLIAGLGVAPMFALAYGLVDRVAPSGSVTEAFTWIATALGSGVAAGTALGATLADAAGARTGFAVAAVAGLLAAAVAARSIRTLR